MTMTSQIRTVAVPLPIRRRSGSLAGLIAALHGMGVAVALGDGVGEGLGLGVGWIGTSKVTVNVL